jgi:O-antigen ligase
MTANFYKRILQAGIILSLATVFLVFPTLLFPYITSKQLVFNILSEALLLIWLVFIWKFPAYRPKKSLITWGLAAFFTALVLSCFNSVDASLSFWGDAERMLGVFHIAHFFILYLVIISVFRTREDWMILLQSSVIIATFVSLRSFFGDPATNKAASTIGNTAYVSGYLIFNIYFAVLLFFKEHDKMWRWLYALPVLIMLIAFNNAHTSGAIIGLGVSILLVVFLVGVLHKSKKLKIAAWSLLVIAVALIAFVFSNTDATWFKNNPRLVALTTQKITFQTRLISWKAAAKDFKNHPIMGVGFGNYATVFDKYFDAKFYDYTKSETYFDRAHNNLIDLASTTGLVGLVSYLSIFVAVAWYLIRGLWRKPQQVELLIIIGLFTAYFIQNLAVFDSLVTYIGLMISLAYVYYLNNSGEDVKTDANLSTYVLSAVALFSFVLVISGSFSGLMITYVLLGIALAAIYLSFSHDETKEVEKKMPEFTMLTIFALIFLMLTSRFNFAPWQAFAGTINGYRQIGEGNVIEAFAAYKEAFSHNTPLDRDSKTALINSIISNPNVIYSLDPVKGQELADYVISLAEENVSHNPQDSLMYLQLAQMYSVGASLKIKDQAALDNYYNRALEAVDKSIAASPQRIPVYFMKANILVSHKNYPQAINTLNEAASFNSNYGEVYCQLYKVYDLAGDAKQAQINGDKCVESTDLESLGMTKSFLSLLDKYYQAKDYKHAIIMAKQLTVFQADNFQSWSLLGQIYGESGDKENARIANEKAALLQ